MGRAFANAMCIAELTGTRMPGWSSILINMTCCQLLVSTMAYSQEKFVVVVATTPGIIDCDGVNGIVQNQINFSTATSGIVFQEAETNTPFIHLSPGCGSSPCAASNFCIVWGSCWETAELAIETDASGTREEN